MHKSQYSSLDHQYMYSNMNVIAIAILSIEWLLFLFLFGRNRYFCYNLHVIAISLFMHRYFSVFVWM